MNRLVIHLLQRIPLLLRDRLAARRAAEASSRPAPAAARSRRAAARPRPAAAGASGVAVRTDAVVASPDDAAAGPAGLVARPDAAAAGPDAAAVAVAPGRFAPPANAEELCDLLRQIVATLQPSVPPDGLPERERQRLGGLLFYGSLQFVHRVRDLLAGSPELSPDAAIISAPALDQRLRRASRWSMVYDALRRLAALANDCYLYEMGHAVSEAQQVIHSFDLALAHGMLQAGGPPAANEDNIVPVRCAKTILSRRDSRRRQARRRNALRLRRIAAGQAAPPRPAGRSGTRGAARPLLDLERWGQAARLKAAQPPADKDQ